MFDRVDKKTHLIHDNSGIRIVPQAFTLFSRGTSPPELKWFDYKSVGITGISITPYSPKAGRKQAFCSPMRPGINAQAERFVRSARRECFDYFIVFNHKQLRNIMREYVRYYNYFRPHQGIENCIPDDIKTAKTGRIRKEPTLFGLYTNYYRAAS